MDGFRLASPIDCTAFQAYRGTPELNCCSTNGPKGIGMLSQWAVLYDTEGLVLNFYGAMDASFSLSENKITIRQETEYPKRGEVRLLVGSSAQKSFTLKLRIPRWSQTTRIRINGKSAGKVTPGEYFSITRIWVKQTVVDIQFDLSLHFWKGERDCQGLTSIYRGPVLLAFDPRFNEMDPDDVPLLVARDLKPRLVEWKQWLRPMLLLRIRGENGRTVHLCDFASAGATGTVYRSWLKVKCPGKCLNFSRNNPLRTFHL